MSRPILLNVNKLTVYPRRILIYLIEKQVDSSLITIAHVPLIRGEPTTVPLDVPAKPAGTLPILAVPKGGKVKGDGLGRRLILRGY
jgi:hypothetical protein